MPIVCRRLPVLTITCGVLQVLPPLLVLEKYAGPLYAAAYEACGLSSGWSVGWISVSQTE